MRLPRSVALAAVGIALVALAGGDARAQGIRSLRQRLERSNARAAHLESTLRELKSQQAQAHRKLQASEDELASSRRRLSRARARLTEVRKALRNVKAEQERTRKELEAHKAAMSERILAMWRSGQSSYFEVVVNATSFDDFSNRVEFAKLVAEQDEQMLDGLAELRERLASQRATMEIKEREAAELRTKIAGQTAAIEQQTRQVRALSQQVDKDRKQAEREYAEELQAAREVEALIRRVRAGGASAGAYSGTSDGRFMRPVNGRLTSPFGYRIHPILHVRRFHNGIDLAVSYGTPIHAAAAGRVIYAGWRGALGNAVVIDHGSGWSTVYGHCSSFACSAGQVVSRGEVIARIGSTGRSTGPHVHWTVYHNGQAVNPLNHS